VPIFPEKKNNRPCGRESSWGGALKSRIKLIAGKTEGGPAFFEKGGGVNLNSGDLDASVSIHL